MESVFSKRNVIVSIILTVAAFVACYFICRAEQGVGNGMLALYSAIIGFFIGLVGEGINYFMQKPKNACWLAVMGGVAAGVLAAAL